MIERLIAALRRLFVRAAEEPHPPPANSSIDRRLWALGYAPDDQDTVVRVRAIEGSLKRLLRELNALGPDDSVTGRHAQELRTEIAEYLDAQQGPLARVVREWPSQSKEQKDVREAILTEGEALCGRAEEMKARWAVLLESRRQVAALQERFEAVVPGAWAPFSGESGLEVQLAQAYSLRRLRSLEISICSAGRDLSDHLAELEHLERELARRLAENGAAKMALACISAEERVERLIEIAMAHVESLRKPLDEKLEDLAARHVDHTGYRPGRMRLRGKKAGSTTRSEVWCEHLGNARKRYRR